MNDFNFPQSLPKWIQTNEALQTALTDVFDTREQAISRYYGETFRIPIQETPVSSYVEVEVYLRQFRLKDREAWKYCKEATGQPDPYDLDIVQKYFEGNE